MDFPTPQKLEDLASLIGARMEGDLSIAVTGTNEIHRVRPGDIVFVNHPKYYEKALQSAATVVLIDQQVECPAGKALLIHPDPFGAFNQINLHFTPRAIFDTTSTYPGLHPSVVVGKDVQIGKDCIIYPNVVLGDRTVIGDRVVIQSNTVIGGDAFYYSKKDTRFERLESVGHVVIEDDVEIGNGCTIDRGVTDVTRIGAGTVMDNQIQIGHDTLIGRRCLIASQVGIAGCCTIGDVVTIWGQVGISSGKKVADGTVLMGKTGVNRDLEKDTYVGMFAEPYREFFRKEVWLRKMAGDQKSAK